MEKTFTRRGCTYTCIDGNRYWSVYEVRDKNNNVYWEVFKKRKRRNVEVYPSNEDFGVWAWCCTTRESLIKVITRLIDGK